MAGRGPSGHLLPFGVVNAPGQRYHPVIVAQAIATLAEMFPGRFWAALGSGEAINEHVTGDPWMTKPLRDQRLLECVSVIRRLLRGEEVDHVGLVEVDRARVWSLPAKLPDLVGAAVSAATAKSVGSWADGLITVLQPTDDLKRVLGAFRGGGGEEAGLPPSTPLMGRIRGRCPSRRPRAMGHQHLLRRRGMGAGDTRTVRRSRPVRSSRGRDRSVLVSCDLGRHAAWLTELCDLGFDGLYLHQIGPDQDRFVETFGAQVLDEVGR